MINRINNSHNIKYRKYNFKLNTFFQNHLIKEIDYKNTNRYHLQFMSDDEKLNYYLHNIQKYSEIPITGIRDPDSNNIVKLAFAILKNDNSLIGIIENIEFMNKKLDNLKLLTLAMLYYSKADFINEHINLVRLSKSDCVWNKKASSILSEIFKKDGFRRISFFYKNRYYVTA